MAFHVFHFASLSILTVVCTCLKFTDATSNIADSCEKIQNCGACVTHGGCYWVIMANETTACVQDLWAFDVTLTKAVETIVSCPQSEMLTLELQGIINLGKGTSQVKHRTISAALEEVDSSIESTEFILYKKKTEISLNFLDTIIPRLQSIHKNMTTLLYNESNSKIDSMTLDLYKEEDRKLFEELTKVGKQFSLSQAMVKQFLHLYTMAERQLKAVHDTLGSLLTP